MTFEHPAPGHTAQLLPLWKTAFGEHEGFWELFLETAFSPERCRCILVDDTVAASLCWFDCFANGQKLAYLYAVVTHPGFRNRGLCRLLLQDVHEQLKETGYTSAILVPAEAGLRNMYEKLGYQTCTWVTEFSCTAGENPVSLRAIGPGEYAALRREFLPEGSVLQEGENLTFLARQAQFYTGTGVLMAAYTNAGTLTAMELLGNTGAAPDITAALGCRQGQFRIPGQEKPFAMFYPLKKEAVRPAYFGFAFD